MVLISQDFNHELANWLWGESMEEVIATKTVNALIPEAEMGFVTKFVVDKSGGKAAGLALEAAKKLMGGLWVGGTVTLYQKTIVFHPNMLNRLVHKAEYTVSIPFEEITDIIVRFGFVTKIIDVITREGKLSFRCYGAEAFSERIRKQLSHGIIDTSVDIEAAKAKRNSQQTNRNH